MALWIASKNAIVQLKLLLHEIACSVVLKAFKRHLSPTHFDD